jgi:hypothetical protein
MEFLDFPLSVLMPFCVVGLPIGFSVELCTSPVFGCCRRGAARL